MSTTLLHLDPDETRARLVAMGAKPFHAKILREAVFAKGVRSYDEITSLPASLRERLARELPLFSGTEVDRSVSRDATTKLLIELPPRVRSRPGDPDAAAGVGLEAPAGSGPDAAPVPGSGTETTLAAGSGSDAAPAADSGSAATRSTAQRPARIETVHIPSLRPERGATLCVSTQVGCPVACPFCASGRLGLERNLDRAEILEQFLRGASLGPLSRVVVMGIGEPLLNLVELQAALQVVREELGIGARKITVSTVGFPRRLDELGPTRPGFQLAISLHSPFDEERWKLVPAMDGVPVAEVLGAGDRWFRATGREVTYEYVLLGGSNDSLRHAEGLAKRLRGRRATVNLIPYNVTGGHDDPFRRPSREAVDAFAESLNEAGVVATVRWSRGHAGDAACGQLRLRRQRA
ncbi:MAG: radical SAM protein [Planctomycetota bacterium]|nr:radical SAM protein [Planctomycetota bacterium]